MSDDVLDGTRTPPAYFTELNRKYRFVVDLFAQRGNELCERFFDRGANALVLDWPRLEEGWCFGNPMYSRGNIEPAVRKAVAEARKGSGVVYIIPATTGTVWFNDLLLRPCDVLDGSTVDNEVFSGYCLSMQGIGYRQKITFLKGRVPWDKPLNYPEEKPWDAGKQDSVIVELRPPLR